MKEITKIKKQVLKLLEEKGFQKISISEHERGMSNVYMISDFTKEIFVDIGNIGYRFGDDGFSGTSAGVAGFGTDCWTAFPSLAFNTFQKHINGEISEEEIRREWGL